MSTSARPSKLFLDMDGVLADFVLGACSAHNRQSPYEWKSSLGIFDMEKLWEISADEFWQVIDNKTDFWDTLEKTPEADELVHLVVEVWSIIFGVTSGTANIAVLTAPSMDPTCVPGKRRWMQKHYPFLAERMIFASAGAKQFLAGPEYLLIDDRDKNVEEFEREGGTAILMPRLWNSAHKRAKIAYHDVEAQLEHIMGDIVYEHT